ncbi:MAG: phage antirepressor KilAC domain-containing protein [Rhizobiales bacterium]|nr:phage antirepressor KilAC domain-containing protein [Hyphomicrobiales bacterium]
MYEVNLFARWLKQEYLFYQGNALVAKTRFIQMGIFEVKSTVVNDKARPQTFVTVKGLEYLRKRVPHDILIENRLVG